MSAARWGSRWGTAGAGGASTSGRRPASPAAYSATHAPSSSAASMSAATASWPSLAVRREGQRPRRSTRARRASSGQRATWSKSLSTSDGTRANVSPSSSQRTYEPSGL